MSLVRRFKERTAWNALRVTLGKLQPLQLTFMAMVKTGCTFDVKILQTYETTLRYCKKFGKVTTKAKILRI